MNNFNLFGNCIHELELTTSIFAEQKRTVDFSDFRKRLDDIGPLGKGRPLMDIIAELRLYVDKLNIEYIEQMKNDSLSTNGKKLFDIYICICSGKEYQGISYEPTFNEWCYLKMIKNVDENNLKYALDLERNIFEEIANKK